MSKYQEQLINKLKVLQSKSLTPKIYWHSKKKNEASHSEYKHVLLQKAIKSSTMARKPTFNLKRKPQTSFYSAPVLV